MTVDKNQFLTLLMRYSGTSLEEAEGIAALKNSYPYSQVLQSLNAKVAKDHSLANHETLLQEAAIHCADRSVLKEIMSAEYEAVGMTVTSEIGHEEGVTEPGEAPKSVETIVPDPVAPEKPAYLVYEAIDGVDVADQVLRDLEKLNTLKHNFEMMFVEYTEVEAGESKTKKESERETFPIEKVEKPKDTSKSKKERIIEMAKALQNSDGVEPGEPSKRKPGKDHVTEELIDEIATTKEEITPETPKQKEQIDIINHFIKISPSITSARDRQPPPPVDLNTVKSGEFGDNIVSETLVEILIKQGKKDKAVEVLKKLIWKYPQKKAYFASQIEDLKK